MKKIMANAIVLSLLLCLSAPTYAIADNRGAQSSVEEGIPVLTDSASISSFLDNSNTTQTIEMTEKEIVTQMLSSNIITRDTLNNGLLELSKQSESTLKDSGYNAKQIESIKSYKEGTDAFTHIFSPASAYANDVKLVFRYGLAGSNTKKTILIAYDMQWTARPTYTYTDSFAIGWLAADSNSYRVLTKIDSNTAATNYKYNDGSEITDGSGNQKSINMVSTNATYVTGNPVLNYNNKADRYGKHISGCTQISSQSDSYNISTIQLFVCYAHTVSTISLDSVTVTVTPTDVSITFDLKNQNSQVMLVNTSQTFAYNDQNVITAIGQSS